MRVQLRRTWFAPNGFRYRPYQGGVEIPDAYADKLPRDAVRLNSRGEPEKKKGEIPIALSQLASHMNPPVDPDLTQVSEAEAVEKGNHVPQATKTGTIPDEGATTANEIGTNDGGVTAKASSSQKPAAKK